MGNLVSSTTRKRGIQRLGDLFGVNRLMGEQAFHFVEEHLKRIDEQGLSYCGLIDCFGS
jgi:hypothetical protein